MDIVITLSGEVQTKSRRTRARFHPALTAALEDAFARAGTAVSLHSSTVRHGRITATADDPHRSAVAAGRVFGVQHVAIAEPVTWTTRESLVDAVAARAAPRVAGQQFAVRVRRFGEHGWRSVDLERDLGTVLLPAASGVDLEHPDVTVRLLVTDETAWFLHDRIDGPGGLPAGVEGRALSLFSGGFDSAVSTWKMMRRGCDIDLLHVMLGCPEADQAALLAWHLWREWGAGQDPTLWVVDGERLRDLLADRVPRQYRQLLLKRIMLRVADEMAVRVGADAIVTGDAVGQVSSQTLRNLRALGTTELPILRPLVGDNKADIVRMAHEIGLGEIAARAREACDLAGGRVVVAADSHAVTGAGEDLPDSLVDDIVASAAPVKLSDWRPGVPVRPAPRPGPVAHAAG